MKPFGVDFHEKDPRPYRERRQDMLRDVHANMDTFEAEKQERRILRMLKRGVTMAQFSEIAISIQRVRDIAHKHGHDLRQNVERPWCTPVHKMKPLHQLKRGRR